MENQSIITQEGNKFLKDLCSHSDDDSIAILDSKINAVAEIINNLGFVKDFFTLNKEIKELKLQMGNIITDGKEDKK